MSVKEIFRDSRSKKVVIVPDYLVNPGRYGDLPRDPAVYEKLRDSGCGLIKMPPPGTPDATLEVWLRITADQVEEYTNREFRIYALSVEGLAEGGISLSALRRELHSRGVTFPETIVLHKGNHSAEELQELLSPMLR